MKEKVKIEELLLNLGLKTDATRIPVCETVCQVEPSQLCGMVNKLLEAGWWHLTAITASSEKAQYILLYHFWLYSGLTLRVEVPTDHARIPSLTSLIPGAAFYEREIEELFGVSFEGLSVPGRLFLAEDWEGDPPMRQMHQGNPESPDGTTGERKAEEA